MTTFISRSLSALLCGAALQAVAGGGASGQTILAANGAPSAPPAAPEVVVTAMKRSSTVQSTPASIEAVTGQDLQARGVTSLATLAQGTPGVSLKSEGPSQTEIEMRGMTSSGGNAATVGFYLDDVPLSGPANGQNGHVVIDPDLYDLSRVEVLRGPQGTLFGAGSMGGTVRLITNPPDPGALHASGESTLSGTEGGGFNHSDNLMINIPLVQDRLALRIVGSENDTSGWIDRVVAAPGAFPRVDATGTVRGDVAAAPVGARHPGSNAYQLYAARVSLLWRPTEDLTITPSFAYETSRQDGVSAYDSVSATNQAPGAGLAHYQPFDIAEPLTDAFRAYSLTIAKEGRGFDVTSSTSYWSRVSTQTEDASEAFNNPDTGVTNAANGVNASGLSYYGANGSGPEVGVERDVSSQFSDELRASSKGGGPFTWVAGLFYSNFHSTWIFNGTTPNFSSYTDLGSLLPGGVPAPATTPNWFDAYEPSTSAQSAAFADATYALTHALKLEVAGRYTHVNYRFSSCITGWGSAQGAATPSCTGVIRLASDSFNPKVTLSYVFDRSLMAYATVASGFRPGGGNALYPTTGLVWGAAFAQMNYTGDRFPQTYKPDTVWSYEVGEKGRFFDRRLTLNVSLYAEHWRDIQLEAYPDDWALNINGRAATIYGAEAEALATLGWGFDLQVSAGTVNTRLDGGPHWDITPVKVLPEVAPGSGTVILTYAHAFGPDLTFTAKLENTYTGRRYSLAFPEPNTPYGQYVPMAAYDLTSIRAGVRFRSAWTATLFVDNLFNTHAQLESLYPENLGSAAFNRVITNQPLTAGVDLSVKF